MQSTPAQEGYRMPAEWEPHEATWLTWPHDPIHWPGKFEGIPKFWARTVKELEQGEDVHIFIHNATTERDAQEAMKKEGVIGDRVHLHRARNNFSWARDHGPVFITNDKGERLILDWQYNAWGGKWEHQLDDLLPREASKITGIPYIDAGIILEGGSIDVNGRGTLLTTEECLLNKNRNPQLLKDQIEHYLQNFLGITNILWLGKGIAGDDTNGHIDDLTRFVEPNTVVTMVEENKTDENYKPLMDNLKRLEKMTDQSGNRIGIITIPMPAPVYYLDMRLPASYANFYVANACVLLPVFNDPHDKIAIEALEQSFPDRKIIPIDSTDLVWGFGSFHCIAQQMPSE